MFVSGKNLVRKITLFSVSFTFLRSYNAFLIASACCRGKCLLKYILHAKNFQSSNPPLGLLSKNRKMLREKNPKEDSQKQK